MTRRRARPVESASRFLLLTVMTVSGAHGVGWQRMPDLPEPNGGMLCFAEDKDILVAGGTNWENGSKRWLSNRWRFSCSTHRWTPLPPLPAPLAYASACGDGRTGSFFTAGGSNGEQTSPSIFAWHGDDPPRLLARLPTPLTLAGAAFAKGKLLVFGGATDIANFSTVSAQCFECPAEPGNVRRLPDFPAGPTALPATTSTAGRVFLFAGAAWDAAAGRVVNRSAAFAFHPQAMKWEPIRPFPFAARGVAAVAIDERRVYLAGGFKEGEQGFTNETFIYDIDENSYAPCAPLPICAMTHLVKTRDWLWMVGGEDRQKHRSSGCWRIPVAELSLIRRTPCL